LKVPIVVVSRQQRGFNKHTRLPFNKEKLILESVLIPKQTQIGASSYQQTQEIKRSAFLFITAEPDCCDMAFRELKNMQEVQEVYFARGAYDLVAKVTAQSVEHLREDVLKRIKQLNSVKSTLTLTIV